MTPRPAPRIWLAVLALLALPGRADELPSPDAMWLGTRIAQTTLVEGFRWGIVDAVLDAALAGRAPADRSALRIRARAAMAPLLDEAFPPEFLAGVGAAFVARHYTAEEIRTLRARESSPLGEKLRAYEHAAAEADGERREDHDRAREALSRRLFDAGERAEIEAFAASPLGRKALGLAPELAAFFLDQLDRRWTSVRTGLEPRLSKAAARLLTEERR